MPKTTYTVAIDFSLHSRRAGDVAARLAARTHAALDFFCAVPVEAAESRGLDPEKVRATLETIARRHAEGVASDAHVAIVTDVAAAIVRHAERSRSSLLVVAPRGQTSWRKLLLGGVTEKVLRIATTSVLVARAERGDLRGCVVVGVDREAAADATLRHAIAVARALRTNLVAVHVVPPPELLVPLAAPGAWRSKLLANATRDMKRFVASRPHRGVRVKTIVLEGSAAETLAAEARRLGAGLVVVGASNKSKLRRVLLGSVAHAVASTSPVSVLVVRSDAPAASERTVSRPPR